MAPTRNRSSRWVEALKAQAKAGEVPLGPSDESRLLQLLGLELDTEPPTEPGVYAVRTAGAHHGPVRFHTNRLVVVRVVADDDGGLAIVYHNYGIGPARLALASAAFRGARWAGPL